jgi:hypothetical protein
LGIRIPFLLGTCPPERNTLSAQSETVAAEQRGEALPQAPRILTFTRHDSAARAIRGFPALAEE